jgi:hypothetical protein
MSDLDALRQILQRQPFCVLGSASNDGEPWVTPVFYNYDASLRLIWESSREAVHSRHIAENPRVAAVVTQLDVEDADEAAYFDCLAVQVPPDRLAEALTAYLDGPHQRQHGIQHRVEDYLGDKPLRLYEAVPYRAYLLDVTYTEDKHRIDSRHEVDLTADAP